MYFMSSSYIFNAPPSKSIFTAAPGKDFFNVFIFKLNFIYRAPLPITNQPEIWKAATVNKTKWTAERGQF